MNKGGTDQGRDALDLWRYISLDRFLKPGELSSATVAKGLRGLLAKLRRTPDTPEAVVSQSDLRGVPRHLLDAVVPMPDWNEPLSALDGALGNWAHTESPKSPVSVVVGSPYSGTPSVIKLWAESQKWRVVASPTAEQILNGGSDWLDQFTGDDRTPLAIPRLERCYLRHSDGLQLVRRLLDRLGELRRRCLIGCNSWAWAYLSKALQIDSALPPPLTLEAFDHERLKQWLWTLAICSKMRRCSFRQSDNGKLVLPPQEVPSDAGVDHSAESPDSTEEVPEVTDFLQHLAAHSRGIPGVAWAIWRQSLQLNVHEEVQDEAKAAAALDQGYTMWVRPWRELKFPGVKDTANRTILFVLHTLLLHDGIPSSMLSELLPPSPIEVVQTLYRLRSEKLLEEEGELWRLTPVAYPAVRQYLNSEGYLVDPL